MYRGLLFYFPRRSLANVIISNLRRSSLSLLVQESIPESLRPALTCDSLTLNLSLWLGVPGIPFIVRRFLFIENIITVITYCNHLKFNININIIGNLKSVEIYYVSRFVIYECVLIIVISLTRKLEIISCH